MIRVLQLLDVNPDHQTETGARQLLRDRSGALQVQSRTIGRGGSYPGVARAILSLRRGADRFELTHAWGERALAVAAVAARTPIVYTPDRFPSPREIQFIRAVMAARELHVITPTDTMRRALVTRGGPPDRCHIIRPGVEFARINRRRDAKLRAQLGIAPDDYVLLACGESTSATAHQLAVWAASILHVLDPKHRLLLWGRGDHAAQTSRFAVKTHQTGLLTVAERELKRRVQFEELLPAADAVLVTAIDPAPTLPISICMASGLPIVAIAAPTIAELLEDRHTALLVGKPAPRLIAQRVLDLTQDPNVQWSISDMARTEAYEYFSLTRYLEHHRVLYRQIAHAEKVELPQQTAGAGLRFHGRAN